MSKNHIVVLISCATSMIVAFYSTYATNDKGIKPVAKMAFECSKKAVSSATPGGVAKEWNMQCKWDTTSGLKCTVVDEKGVVSELKNSKDVFWALIQQFGDFKKEKKD